MGGRRRQVRIWWIMALVGVVAAVVGAITSPLDKVALGVFITLCFGFLFASAYVIVVFLPYFLVAQRLRCPACGSRMACVVVVLFRPPLLSLHLCPSCPARFKRFPVGGWRDASGVEHARWFPPVVVPDDQVVP